MPIFTPLQLFDFESVTADFRPIGEDRSVGLHWSQIIRVMKEQAGEKVTGIEGEQDWLRAQVGFLWERVFEQVFKDYMGVTRPVEKQLHFQVDGIALTPDGYHTEDRVLEEYKLTWKSMRKWYEDPEQYFWSWLEQVKGYLYALNVTRALDPPVLECRFIICWVRGDYVKLPGDMPTVAITTTSVTFTWDEIEQTWKAGSRYKAFIEGLKGGEDV